MRCRNEQVRVKGTPQGGPLSPLLANIYLDALDKELEVSREKSGSGPTDQSSLLGFRIDRRSEVSVAPEAMEKLKSRVRECWRSCQSKTSNRLRDQWKQYIEG